jgi:hypothetical protein
MLFWTFHRQCPGCHSTDVSRRLHTTVWDRILEFVFILRGFHCHYCGRRFYGWLRMNS